MAKRFDHLFEQVCSFENLYNAFRKACKGKSSVIEVATFEQNLELNLIGLQDALRAGTWQPGGSIYPA
jgi:RNA-directed DNA polymerase